MRVIVAAFSLLFTSVVFAFQSFDSESRRVTNNIACANPKVTSGSGSWGDLYGCVGGRSETVKFFINERPGSGEVDNIKFIWNDWTQDGGFGVHADSTLAESWVTVVATMYAPTKVDQVVDAFFNDSDRVIESESYTLNFTFHSGPRMDERMFVIVEK